ncbi:MAG: hypothetical protein HYV28_07140 [Ignavibacteriales bacterium]|nr:hypothetical protein [Ignavibacteriales bacterium]
MKKEKIFFLYLKTGGGHLAPARSIIKYLANKYPGQYDLELINSAEEMIGFFRYSLEDGYRILQSSAKWYYEFLYFTNKFRLIAYWNRSILNFLTKSYLEKRILAEKPDKIVVFHFFCYQPVFEILRKYNLNIPVVTVVTDPYTAHPLWFLRPKQNFVLFSERLREHCNKLGIPDSSLSVFPFILDEKFSNPPGKTDVQTLRQRYGLNEHDKMILVLGGGDGIPKGYSLMKTLIANGPRQPIAIVCGRNKKLFDQCTEMVKEAGRTDIKIYGYVDFVFDLLHISDVVITKCGASTFMEIIHSKKIPIIIDYLWEQEKGNVEYLVKNGMGIYEPDVSRIPAILDKLFSDKKYFESYIQKIEEAKLVNGTAQVAEHIRNFK